MLVIEEMNLNRFVRRILYGKKRQKDLRGKVCGPMPCITVVLLDNYGENGRKISGMMFPWTNAKTVVSSGVVAADVGHRGDESKQIL